MTERTAVTAVQRMETVILIWNTTLVTCCHNNNPESFIELNIQNPDHTCCKLNFIANHLKLKKMLMIVSYKHTDSHKQIKLYLRMLRCSVQTLSPQPFNHIIVKLDIHLEERPSALLFFHQKKKKKLLIQLMSLVNSPLSKNRIRSAYDTGCTQGQDKHLQITFHAEHALGVAYGFLKTTFCLIVSVWNSQFILFIKIKAYWWRKKADQWIITLQLGSN